MEGRRGENNQEKRMELVPGTLPLAQVLAVATSQVQNQPSRLVVEVQEEEEEKKEKEEEEEEEEEGAPLQYPGRL